MTGSPISDLNPIFLASGIKLNVCNLNRGRRQITMDENFFTGYRRNVIASNEILESIEIPYSCEVQLRYPHFNDSNNFGKMVYKFFDFINKEIGKGLSVCPD